ncbi:MAG TPA: methylated-DNA--[protein]-cysteine S-methyltransferase [Solirubrobacteraceae bacterium]
MTTAIHETTLGRVAITTDGDALAALRLEPAAAGTGGEAAAPAAPPTGVAAEAARQIDAYLAGERADFDLPLAPAGTPFEQDVWRALREIPYGETSTYGRLAAELGSHARAVGRANGRNPLWIVVPCHRVIGADGSLTGYAGGLDVKRRLLDLESRAVVGVRTTKIYCRPSCTPPRAPLPANTRRYPSAAAARAAGLRACKLCKPD